MANRPLADAGRFFEKMTAVTDAPASYADGETDAKIQLGKGRIGNWVVSASYYGIQLGSLSVFFFDFELRYLVLCAATFYVRLWAITGAYHRYFSHRSYSTSRMMQFMLALLGVTAVQKGPLWWAGVHRNHHQHSDKSGDPHSPRHGFWHAHHGWLMNPDWDATRLDQVRDLARYPELRWLNRWHIVGPVLCIALCYAVAGWAGVAWGFLLSTTLCWHTTYSINSLAHRMGRQRYETGDDSRNSLLLGILILGEGWHNNHHFHQSCARQGFFWWEIDITYYVLRALSAVGLIWDLKEPPARAYREQTRSHRTPVSPSPVLD